MSNCGQTPIIWLVLGWPIYKPDIHAFPEVWGYMPVRTDIRVVFPAPFGPRNPNISPLMSLIESGFKAIACF
jgi:hypothetical protein